MTADDLSNHSSVHLFEADAMHSNSVCLIEGEVNPSSLHLPEVFCSFLFLLQLTH